MALARSRNEPNSELTSIFEQWGQCQVRGLNSEGIFWAERAVGLLRPGLPAKAMDALLRDASQALESVPGPLQSLLRINCYAPPSHIGDLLISTLAAMDAHHELDALVDKIEVAKLCLSSQSPVFPTLVLYLIPPRTAALRERR